MVESRPVHVKSDSEYVVKGCLRHRFTWAALGWHKVRNADLWQEAHSFLQERRGQVVMFKVKGHATWRDVRHGRVLAADKHGNDKADALATAGAAMHSLSKQFVSEHLTRTKVTYDLQHMMVDIDILFARSKASIIQAPAITGIR